MEVITIESHAWKSINDRLILQADLFQKLVKEIKENNSDKWLSIGEVCDLTGFSRRWVDDRKEKIGFFQDGKDLKFRKSDVEKYMEGKTVKAVKLKRVI